MTPECPCYVSRLHSPDLQEILTPTRYEQLHNSSRQLIEIDAGYIWSSHQQFAVIARIEMPLTKLDLHFKSILSLSWYF